MFHVVAWLWPLVWFLVKLFVVAYTLIWVRATLPRFRYDRLMSFGWKGLIPAGLLWIMVTGAAITLPQIYSNLRAALIILFGTIAIVALLIPLFTGAPRGLRRLDEVRR
jgi:NADH-quinone oxidoreductase subunit H